MSEALKPCPHCGTGPNSDYNVTQAQFYRNIASRDGYVWCEGCGAAGPTRETRDEAIVAWNTRIKICGDKE